MTNPVADQHGYWTALAQQAVSGDLRLEPELGEALRAAAKRYAERLTAAKDETQYLENLSGWGTLPSAVAIRKKFEAKAVAGGAHDPNDSAAHRIQEHIDIAWLQHDTFAAAIGKLELIDEERAAALRVTGQDI